MGLTIYQAAALAFVTCWFVASFCAGLIERASERAAQKVNDLEASFLSLRGRLDRVEAEAVRIACGLDNAADRLGGVEEATKEVVGRLDARGTFRTPEGRDIAFELRKPAKFFQAIPPESPFYQEAPIPDPTPAHSLACRTNPSATPKSSPPAFPTHSPFFAAKSRDFTIPDFKSAPGDSPVPAPDPSPWTTVPTGISPEAALAMADAMTDGLPRSSAPILDFRSPPDESYLRPGVSVAALTPPSDNGVYPQP